MSTGLCQVNTYVYHDVQVTRPCGRPEVGVLSNHDSASTVTTSADFEAILDSLVEGILTLNDDGEVIGINRAACEILETSKRDAIRLGCPCLLGHDVCAPGSLLRESIARRRLIHDYQVELETESGRRKVLSLSTAVFRSGRKRARGGVIVFRDVTEIARLRHDLRERYRLHNVIGKSKPIQDVFRLIEQVADSDATVLVEGETGTGKELVARAIHHLGPRAAGPFVAVNCSALPESLLESELFGHVRGAFTGALRDKPGRFETAAGGTIFLDEIGDVSADVQVKLLRVLQERTIERVGGEGTIPVDIRVIAATNRPLADLVSAGRFREDLFYRLRVVPIALPALRGRRDDVPLLAQHFVEKYRSRTGRPIQGVDEDALALMLDYSWPGNVRELENVIEYAFVKARGGFIGPAHLPPELLRHRTGSAPLDAWSGHVKRRKPRRPDLTRQHLQRTLDAVGWNVARAARRLQVSRTTLYKRMTASGLGRPDD